jgi:hypothetical protein
MKKLRVESLKVGVTLAALTSIVAAAPAAHAALTANSQLSQQVTAGTLSTSIRDGAGAVVASPSFSMGSVAASTSVQTATETFGSASQRITVDNPGGADNGWVLSLAATGGATATWTSGANTYAFNGTGTTGQMTINPAAATLVPTTPNTATGVTKGTSGTFTGATPITLLTAGTTAEKIWNGYITGVGVSQVIPANQPLGTYTIDMTQTVAAS